MLKKTSLYLLSAFALITSCSEPAQIEGFDSQQWKNDRYACNGIRKEMISQIDSIRKQLYGKKEQDIKDILGKPDSEELMSRGQRVFIYYLEPGSHCNQKDQLSEANRLQVRLNATYKVNEVTYAQPLRRENR
ncbi:hypothetical protein [Pontibacter harenae]|uniref:hypothetical protein n=1 Tax=Pontibacter harenae TaxID=2894083 RepID=UPI001E4A2329|nr:hypothetical protein [Pontibacter harenae]MCC9167622.1 hypothetical protein [Pontibacter harenae]